MIRVPIRLDQARVSSLSWDEARCLRNGHTIGDRRITRGNWTALLRAFPNAMLQRWWDSVCQIVICFVVDAVAQKGDGVSRVLRDVNSHLIPSLVLIRLPLVDRHK